MRETISIDFDGVIHDYAQGWSGYAPSGPPVPGALQFVEDCLNHELEVIISSCRAYTQIGREGIRNWLEQHGFPAERILVTCEKPHARWYLDDRAIRFDGSFFRAWDAMKEPVWFEVQPEPAFDGGA